MVNQKLLNKLKIHSDYFEILVITLLAVVARILPHPPNVAPIAGLALYSGSRIGKSWAVAFPLIAMLISDYVIGFHDTVAYVYGSFFVIAVLGMVLRSNPKWGKVAIISVVSSLVFFFITNFGVWRQGIMYPQNINGLLSAYWMGIPFLRNTLIGDLVYANVFFFGFQIVGLFVKRLTPLFRANLRQ